MLDVTEREIVPLTRTGVEAGNKTFGGAVLREDDLTTVVAVTNRETTSPLNEEIWRVEAGRYDHCNRCWCAWHIRGLIDARGDQALADRSDRLAETYAELSTTYQRTKGTGAEIPLP